MNLSFNLDNAKWIPDIVKERLIKKHKNRITKDNNFQFSCETFRTQYENKKGAFDRLQEMIDEACYPEKERIETEMPQQMKERFKELNKEHDFKKKRFKESKRQTW